MKSSFLNLIFSFYLINTYINGQQSFLQMDNNDKTSALFITGTDAKSVINFSIKNSLALLNLGLIDKHFQITSGDNKILEAHKDKTVILSGTSILLNTISTQGSITFNEVPQWRMVYHDTWTKNNTSLDWSIENISTCKSFKILGGNCQVSNKEIFKTYELSGHSHVKIEAFYHFIGDWESNTGYMKINEKYVWSHRCNSEHKPSVKICPDFEICKIAVLVSTTIAHSDKSLKLTFGSTLDGNPCDKSYGVSDIRIYIK
jgi:hypothetical protein